MIHFERTLPMLAMSIRKAAGFGTDSGPGHPSRSSVSGSRPSTTMRASTGADSETPDDTTVLVPGLTWADTVDLAPW